MKKVVIILSIAILAISIALVVFIVKSRTINKSKNPTDTKDVSLHTQQLAGIKRMALNGITYDEANKWINEFQGAPGSYDSPTTIWFSKRYVDSLDSLLTAEQSTLGTDGIRIYFARNENKENTIAIVSTLNDGPDPNRPNKNMHLDYFKHSAAFLDSSFAKNSDEGGDKDYGDKLIGKTQCPVDNCTIITSHAISCKDASNWASFMSDGDIKINSEWFDKELITYIREELDSPDAIKNMADGIRIYYARRTTDNKHVFILVTTQLDGKNHRDYYTCYNSKHSVNGFTSGNDNGEQCPDNCTGSTLPK
jgi:hypothetical protein